MSDPIETPPAMPPVPPPEPPAPAPEPPPPPDLRVRLVVERDTGQIRDVQTSLGPFAAAASVPLTTQQSIELPWSHELPWPTPLTHRWVDGELRPYTLAEQAELLAAVKSGEAVTVAAITPQEQAVQQIRAIEGAQARAMREAVLAIAEAAGVEVPRLTQLEADIAAARQALQSVPAAQAE
jgi:hypothetical protein